MPLRPSWRHAGWAAIWCFAATLVSAAETLRVATYNVENYVAANRMTTDGFRQDYPKPEVEKQALRDVIRVLDADVLVLQEMGARPYLEELTRDLATDGVNYPHAALLDGADADRHVAILSRRAFRSTVGHTDLGFTYFGEREKVKRGLLEVRVDFGGDELTLFALHLKSRFSDRPDDPESTKRRTEEATAIRDRVLQRCPEPASQRFLILGDFNDAKDSKPVQRFLLRGQTRISILLPAADAQGETWTHFYRKRDVYSRVDHILVSPALRPFVQDGTARIFDAPGVTRASDHRPVVVVLEAPEKK